MNDETNPGNDAARPLEALVRLRRYSPEEFAGFCEFRPGCEQHGVVPKDCETLCTAYSAYLEGYALHCAA